MSGIAIHDDCVNRFNELKLAHSYRYLLFKMSPDLTNVVLEKTSSASASWEEFESDLPKDDCRYGIFDFEYEKDGGRRNKIVFVVWCPETSKIKSKMLYTSTKDSLKKKLVGIGCEVQATDASEIQYSEVLSRVDKI
jgi:cofilin